MSDLTERLRSLADCDARAGEPLGKCMREAADALAAKDAEIERLTQEIDGWHADLRSALGVILRRGDTEALKWLEMNYPSFVEDETKEDT